MGFLFDSGSCALLELLLHAYLCEWRYVLKVKTTVNQVIIELTNISAIMAALATMLFIGVTTATAAEDTEPPLGLLTTLAQEKLFDPAGASSAAGLAAAGSSAAIG